jgi:hypothetical protein
MSDRSLALTLRENHYDNDMHKYSGIILASAESIM